MYRYLLFTILILVGSFSCKTSKKIQTKTDYSVLEETGILVSYNKESNWFIPLKIFDAQKDALNNLYKDNMLTGIYLDYTIDDELFRFLNNLKTHQNVFKTDDNINRELIPVRIKFKKIVKASDDSCELIQRENSFYFYDQLIKYNVNSCYYISISIKQLNSD